MLIIFHHLLGQVIRQADSHCSSSDDYDIGIGWEATDDKWTYVQLIIHEQFLNNYNYAWIIKMKQMN